jgi:zinc transporter ZupT
MPVGISLAAVLMAAPASRTQVVWATVLPGLAIPLATGLTVALLVPSDQVLGLLIGIAGDVLDYKGAAHLLPEAQVEHPSRMAVVLFTATLLTAVCVSIEPQVSAGFSPNAERFEIFGRSFPAVAPDP